MGTVRTSLTISTTDVLATAVSITAAKNFAADSGVILRAKVAEVSGGGSGLTVYKASDKTTSAYLYVRNLNPELENYIYVYNDTDSDAAVAKIGGGEFCYIPVPNDKTFKAYGTLVNQLVEYAVFGNDDSANTLG